MGQIPETAAARRALKVAEIKALLEEAGLATDGTKPVLLERLEEVRSRFYPAETIPNPPDPGEGPAADPSLPSSRCISTSRRLTAPTNPTPSRLPHPTPSRPQRPSPSRLPQPRPRPPPPRGRFRLPRSARFPLPRPSRQPRRPAQEEENADEDEDGGEKYVLVAPAPTPIESLKSMCEGCVAVEDIRGGMALLEFESERGARDAVTALASKQCEAEIARRTLWQDDLDDADLTSTTLHVDGVSRRDSRVHRAAGVWHVRRRDVCDESRGRWSVDSTREDGGAAGRGDGDGGALRGVQVRGGAGVPGSDHVVRD